MKNSIVLDPFGNQNIEYKGFQIQLNHKSNVAIIYKDSTWVKGLGGNIDASKDHEWHMKQTTNKAKNYIDNLLK